MASEPDHPSSASDEPVTLRRADLARYERMASQLADAERIARVGIWEWDVPTGQAIWSDEIFRLFGHEPGAFEPSFERWIEAIHPDDRERCQQIVQESFAAGVPYEFEHRVVWSDGTITHLHCRGDVSTDDAGRPIRVVGASQDVTPRVAQQAALASLARQREAILDSVGDAICGVDAEGLIRFANPAAAEMLGREVGQLGGAPIADFIRDAAGEWRPFASALEAGESVSDRGAAFLRADGTSVPVDLLITPIHDRGRVTGAVVAAKDATERRRFEEQIARLAEHDALTGLFNRDRFEQELELQVAVRERYAAALSVLLIDLDGFKDLNDTRGHRVGDELMCSVAQLVEGRLRAGDVLARIGGDELAVLLPATASMSAVEIAEGIRRAIDECRHVAGGDELRATASIGIASTDGNAITAQELLANADIAMYEAKDGGRNRVVGYAAEQRGPERAAERFEWVSRLRHALGSGGGFELHAQPIHDVAAGRVSQYELLLRLRLDDGALVLPGSFLPTAERHGLIRAIDRWVVERSIEIAAGYADDVRFEINLSGVSVGDHELPRFIADHLERRGVDPSRIIFEMTETAAVDSLHDARVFAQSLRELGCRFALDDFGSGFSSFVYLKHLPIDYVKIDGDFVRGITDSASDRLFVEAIVSIARGLGKLTIAEFVEDEPTATLLAELDVDYLQGFHIGRPAPVAEALAPAPAV